MQGEINKLSYNVQDQAPAISQDFNKIAIIKAFRDYAKYLEFDSSAQYMRVDELRAQIRELTNQLEEVQNSINTHYDNNTGTIDAVDSICDEYCISERARQFLQSTPSGLKEQKDAVELMMAIGEIKGRPQRSLEESWDQSPALDRPYF